MLTLKNIKGKLYADKGYIGQTLFENLYLNGIQSLTKVKNNMKNSLINALSAIAAFCFFEKKPAIDVNFIKDRQLTLF